ncbi:MAG: hypothetical protein ACSHX8_16165 [Opitutaceae bacterium]
MIDRLKRRRISVRIEACEALRTFVRRRFGMLKALSMAEGRDASGMALPKAYSELVLPICGAT